MNGTMSVNNKNMITISIPLKTKNCTMQLHLMQRPLHSISEWINAEERIIIIFGSEAEKSSRLALAQNRGQTNDIFNADKR